MSGLALTLALVMGQNWIVPGGTEDSFGGAFSFGGDGFGPAGSAGIPVLYAPLNATGPLLPDDSGTVSHVYWDGASLQDSIGNSWSMNGTVPQAAANVSPFVPGKAGAGPYSAANNYQGSTSLMEWAGDWSVTVVFKASTSGAYQILAAKTSGVNGWYCAVTPTGEIRAWTYDGAAKVVASSTQIVANAINVATCGRSGASIYARVNGGASGTTAAIGTMTSGAAEPVRLGRYGPAGVEALTATIYEILASTTPYSDALHLARYQRVFGMLTQQGQAISVTRATDQTYTANSLVWSTPNDTLSTGTDGVEVWKAAVQLYPTPSAPAAGSATATATGTHTFSVVGTGSQQISAGTATTTGLPCTATEAAPCVFGVTVTGTLTLAAVTGSLTYGQIEVGGYRTPQILTFPATRNAGVVTTPMPDLGNKWCVSVTAKPGSGRAWTAASVYVLSGGTVGMASSFRAYTVGGTLVFDVFDSTPTVKTWTTAAHGFSAGSSHRLTFCDNSGTMSVCGDGVSLGGAASGAGTGLLSAAPTPMYLGTISTGASIFDGALSNLKVCKGATRCGDCR